MAAKIIWRYRRKHPESAARSRKQEHSFGNFESQAAGSSHMMQFAEEEEVQTKLQFQEEEEEEMQMQFQEEEEEELQAKSEPLQKRSNRLIRSVAGQGFKGNPGSYPFAKKIQSSFGGHDISQVKSFQDAAASQANSKLGARAYASREKVAFRGYPDLHTAAHEAAHVVQQRQGVDLKDGTGQKGDPYERHADAVADRVVQGGSVEGLLSENKN